MPSEGAAEGGLLLTTVVGSYPQPDWLVDKELLKSQPVPRVRIEALWRVQDGSRGEALQRAALEAIRDMETAGVDVITDGEIAREGYGTRFVSALSGLDEVTPAVITFPNGRTTKVPRVVGPVRHQRFVEVDAATFLRE